MAAANSDLIRNATPNFATTLANSMLVSDTTMTLQSTTGLPTGTGITLTIDATDPVSGDPTPALEETVTGVVSGSTVTSLLRGKDNTTAQAHASGANVDMLITANLWNDWQTAYLTSHNQAGGIVATSPTVATSILDVNGNTWIGQTATGSAVNYINVTDNSTGNAPIISAKGSDNNVSMNLVPKGTGNVQVNGNPVWQYLGYAQITTTYTTTQQSLTDVTGLSVTVTVPAGNTQVRITCYSSSFEKTGTSGDLLVCYLREGSTTLGVGVVNIAGSNYSIPFNGVALVPTVSAGSHTYKVSTSQSTAGTIQMAASSTSPTFILVECC